MLERKITFKLPPTTIRDVKLTQEARRSKALEEQKRRRAQKFDSSRQLDVFADLTLSDEDEDEDEQSAMAPSAGVASFVPAMKEQQAMISVEAGSQATTSKKKSKRKRRGGRNANKPSKWADKCMYAELLEMVDPCMSPFDSGDQMLGDGLPTDLETGWVAVAPVPVGKRCLAVTYQSSGVAGVAPNTTLRSRLLGKTLISRFPSALPPLTILDCILDAKWKDNGILHVLDVIKWKGQDVGDCEARFRFWWRDTRLTEITQSTPSMTGYQTTVPLPMVSVPSEPAASASHTTAAPPKYQFSYPTMFLPVPYHTDTSLSYLYEQIIPSTRTMRNVTISVPVFNSGIQSDTEDRDTGGMDVDAATGGSLGTVGSRGQVPVPTQQTFSFSFAHHAESAAAHEMPQSQPLSPQGKPTARFTAATAVASAQVNTFIQPDGLLLYVAESSYEPGTSPLSSWIPIVGYEKEEEGGSKSKTEVKRDRENGADAGGSGSGPLKRAGGESPLDLFERLVKRRMERNISGHRSMDMDL